MSRKLNRRLFLRGAGVTLALPMLEALTSPSWRGPGLGARAHADQPQPAARARTPRRFVAICSTLSLHTPFLFPTEAGRNYTATPYLEALADFRNELTVCSGLSHPGVQVFGHSCLNRFLTGAYMASGIRNTISVDQLAAEQLGGETRFASLQLQSGALGVLGPGISVNRSGVVLPAVERPSQVYARLFLNGRPEEVRAQTRRLRDGQSILDVVQDQTRQLQNGLPVPDRELLDEYFTSVREVEQRLVKAEEWTNRPRPTVSTPAPRDVQKYGPDCITHIRLMFDLIHLAIQTDSTRFITIPIDCGQSMPQVEGITEGHHSLSHHDRRPEKIEQLKRFELELIKAYRDLLAKLKNSREEGENLLDRTMVLFGSHMGNAATHSTSNVPTILAGGGLQHGQHLAFDTVNNAPLCNLYLSILQRLGLEIASFGSSRSTLRGLQT